MNTEIQTFNFNALTLRTLASRKPEAHEPKRWMTHEVLPSIRKHGIYALETTTTH